MRALGCSTFGTAGGERNRSSPTAGWTWHSNHRLQTTSELSCINSHRSLLIVLTPTSTGRRIRYGAMWWLNTDGEKGRMYPSAPTTSYTAQVSSRTTHTTPKRKMCVLCGQLRSAGPLHGCHSRPLCLQGAGGNYIWIEPTLDLVVVVRWCGDFKGFTEAVMAALEPAPAKL